MNNAAEKQVAEAEAAEAKATQIAEPAEGAEKQGRRKRLQPRRKTVERYGTSGRTVLRWERDARYAHLKFPQPHKINGRKYDDVDALDTWDEAMAERGRAEATSD